MKNQRGEDLPRFDIEPEDIVLELSNGNMIVSSSEKLQAGDWVSVRNSEGEERGYWHWNEWQEDPRLVMGAILMCAMSTEPPP